MAEVFVGSVAGAEGFSRKVAIKRVLPGYSDNPGFAKMFVSEAQISSQLVHPNIVSVVDFDRDSEGRLFLVMELVDGKDLSALIETGLLPPAAVVFVIAEVLRGLGFAHDLPIGTGMRGIVHRDMSPHNVLMSWEGAVKVSDFGIAKARAASEATASVFIKGKPAYMSPEQANGQALDGRSDLFAVGVMLWEMLVGQRLFTAEDTRATLAAVLFGQIPRPRSVRPAVPKDLERVTMKLLERDLAARYGSADEAIDDLMACSDAPRSGRELLKTTLAKRFPKSAPVRQSAARRRVAAPIDGTAPPSGGAAGRGHAPSVDAPAPIKRTLPDSAGGPVATPAPTKPGLETVMSAETATMDVRPAAQVPERRTRLLPIVIAVAIISAVLGFIVVWQTRAPTPVEADDAASSPTDAAGGVQPVRDAR